MLETVSTVSPPPSGAPGVPPGRPGRWVAALAVLGLLSVLLVAGAQPASSAGGTLDTTFGSSGAVVTDFGGSGSFDAIAGLAIYGTGANAGKIVMAGITAVGTGLVRLNADGSYDTSFGAGGSVSSNAMYEPKAIAIDGSGRLLVTGRSAASNGSLVVARYTATGVLDSTFGTSGKVTVAGLTDSGALKSGGEDVAVQSDGKVVVAASDGGDVSLFRFSSAGVADTSFDTDGRVNTGADSSGEDSLAIQSDGKILVTAMVGTAGGLRRYSDTGVADTSFDSDGAVTTANHLPRALTLQSDGKSITAGSFNNDALVVRRNVDGSLDTGFDTDGVASVAVSGLSPIRAHAAAVTAAGIVIAGRLDNTAATSGIFVARLTTGGALDSTFATGGVATFLSASSQSTATVASVVADGTTASARMVVGGSLLNTSRGLSATDNDFLVLRVHMADPPATTTTTTTTTTTPGATTTSTTTPGGTTSTSTTSTTAPEVAGSVPAGGSSASEVLGVRPTPTNRVIVGVTTPIAGVLGFTKNGGDQVSGFKRLGGVAVTAPTATVTQPLRITMAVDVSTLSPALPLGAVVVLRDKKVVPECESTAIAAPDPCVLSRKRVGNELTITSLSSAASTWTAARPVVQRVFGDSRILSAIATSRSLYADRSAEAVVIVRSDSYADALAATPLAVAKRAPLLFTGRAELNDATLDEVTRVLAPGKTVFLLGGVRALSETIPARLASWDYKTVRLFGANRFETAVAVATRGLGSPGTVILTTGFDFADALAAGAAAAKIKGAVLLTDGGKMPAATAGYLRARRPVRYALGGQAARADRQARAMAGADRYETSVLAAKRFFIRPGVIGVASGLTYPDALTGGVHVAMSGGPLLLVPPTGSLPVAVKIYLRPAPTDAPALFLYGGEKSVEPAVAAALQSTLGA